MVKEISKEEEIEKKYLIKDEDKESLIEFIKGIIPITIQQNYLSVTDDNEVRIRIELFKNEFDETDTTKQYTLTKKGGNGLVREEIEEIISQGEYHFLAEGLKNKKPIHKDRYKVDYKGFTFEVDVYQNKELNSLIIVEVELTSEEQVKELETILPSFITEDVTLDKQYKNKNLWKKINS